MKLIKSASRPTVLTFLVKAVVKSESIYVTVEAELRAAMM